MLTPNQLLPEAWTLVTFNMDKAEVQEYVDNALEEGDLCLKSWGMTRDEMVQHLMNEHEVEYLIPADTSDDRIIDLAMEFDLGRVLYELSEPSSSHFVEDTMLIDDNDSWRVLERDEIGLVAKPEVDLGPDFEDFLAGLEEVMTEA